MEVKDLIKNELTEQEQIELELQEKKDKYNKTQKYINTEEFTKLCEEFKAEWDLLFEEIKLELKNRKKVEAIKSEINKIEQDVEYYKAISKKLGKSEWEKVFKDELKIRIENAESNMFVKVAPDELFDLPVYTKLDMLKMKRNSYSTVGKYLTLISEWFYNPKTTVTNPNPYENENMTEEEFKLLTDTK